MAFLVPSKVAMIVGVLLLVLAQTTIEATNKDKALGRRLFTNVAPSSPPKLDCDAACAVRCSKHSRPNVCKRACGTCCSRCHCVPSGQSGNREECGTCYTDMKTHNNQTKCP